MPYSKYEPTFNVAEIPVTLLFAFLSNIIKGDSLPLINTSIDIS